MQTEEWSSPAGGTISIETPGKPTSISGTLALAESGGRTTETLDVEVKVKVPLIGGKLEKLMADLVAAGHGQGARRRYGVAGGSAMKKVTEELRYDGATIQQVNEMLADPAFREQVCEYQHVCRHTVQIKASGQGMTVVVDQIQAARGIPSFAKKFVGDEINIVQSRGLDLTGEGQPAHHHPRQARRDDRHRPAHRGPRRHHRDGQPHRQGQHPASSAARSRA